MSVAVPKPECHAAVSATLYIVSQNSRAQCMLTVKGKNAERTDCLKGRVEMREAMNQDLFAGPYLILDFSSGSGTATARPPSQAIESVETQASFELVDFTCM